MSQVVELQPDSSKKPSNSDVKPPMIDTLHGSGGPLAGFWSRIRPFHVQDFYSTINNIYKLYLVIIYIEREGERLINKIQGVYRSTVTVYNFLFYFPPPPS